MPIDMNIGAMRMPFDGAIDTMAKISGLAKMQAMAPYQFEAARLANQHAQQVNALASQMSPLQLQQAQLANQRLRGLLPYQLEQARLANQHQQFIAQHPLMGMPGAAGQIGAALYAQKMNQAAQPQQAAQQPTQQQPPAYQQSVLQGGLPLRPTQPSAQPPMQQVTQSQSDPALMGMSPDSPAGRIMNAMAAAQKLQKSRADYYDQKVSGAGWTTQPAADKAYQLSVARALGYGGQEAANLFMQGKSLRDLAKAQGIDLDKVDPTGYTPPTSSTITNTQKVRQAVTALDALAQHTTPALAPYSRRFGSVSPKLIAQELKGQNPESQARYLASRALAPEITAARIRAMQGNVGEKAMEKIQEASLGKMKNFEGLVSPKVFARAQELQNQWLSEATMKGIRSVINLGKPSIGQSDAPVSPQVGSDAKAQSILNEFRNRR
jgi:hypothetical protein